MILNARVLRTGFVPSEVEHRDSEVNHLSQVLQPITDNDPAETIVVTGPSGAGKTCVTQLVAERLREVALAVESSYVNCWRDYTRFRALYSILEDIGQTVDIHRQSTPHDELVDRINQYEGPQTVIILDEVDQLENPDILYNLHSHPQFALICIANREEALMQRLDDRLVSRLRGSEHVRMERYHEDQLVDILAARARQGLEPDVITEKQLREIADAAAGDARLAIGILRSAASMASRKDATEVTDEMVAQAATDAQAEIKQRNLDALTPHQRAVYDIVHRKGPIGPGDIYDYYCDTVDDPRTQRTVRAYLSKMEQYNLLRADGKTKDRRYESVDNPSPESTA